MIVLGLDMATQSGVAYGPPGELPTLETLNLHGDHVERHTQACRHVRRICKDVGASHVFAEAAFIKRTDSYDRVYLLTGLVAAAGISAGLLRLPFQTFTTSQIDKAVLGGRLHGRENRKDAVMAWAVHVGLEPATQDEADAASVWQTGCALVAPEKSLALTGIFGTARVKA